MDADSLAPGFGARLSAARQAAGLTQEALGEGLGPDGKDLGRGAVSSWEVGRTQPSAGQLAAIAERLKVSADALLGLPDGEQRTSSFVDLPAAVQRRALQEGI